MLLLQFYYEQTSEISNTEVWEIIFKYFVNIFFLSSWNITFLIFVTTLTGEFTQFFFTIFDDFTRNLV